MRAKLTSTVFGVALLAACATSDGKDENVGLVSQPIVGGSSSGASDDATVMLVILDSSGTKRLGICTAALVAPRLVLTARHCVAEADEVVACNADGTPLIDAKISGNRDATSLYVFTGKDRPASIGSSPDTTNWKPAGRGVEIIDDGSTTLCDHDLALVLLDKPIDGVPIAPLRLDGEVGSGERLRTVGWGVTREEAEPQTRQQRGGVLVKRVGPSEEIPVLTKSEFLFDESICLGDSGGPVFAQDTGAIVGVVSRGGNGLDPVRGQPASTCEGADNLATKLAPFKSLIMQAFERAGAEPQLEERPDDSGCNVSATGGTHGGQRFAAPLLFAVSLISALTRKRRPRPRH